VQQRSEAAAYTAAAAAAAYIYGRGPKSAKANGRDIYAGSLSPCQWKGEKFDIVEQIFRTRA